MNKKQEDLENNNWEFKTIALPKSLMRDSIPGSADTDKPLTNTQNTSKPYNKLVVSGVFYALAVLIYLVALIWLICTIISISHGNASNEAIVMPGTITFIGITCCNITGLLTCKMVIDTTPIKCPECNHQVSSTTKQCPKCGAPISSSVDSDKPIVTKRFTINSALFFVFYILAGQLFWSGLIWLVCTIILTSHGNVSNGALVMPGIITFIGIICCCCSTILQIIRISYMEDL